MKFLQKYLLAWYSTGMLCLFCTVIIYKIHHAVTARDRSFPFLQKMEIFMKSGKKVENGQYVNDEAQFYHLL